MAVGLPEGQMGNSEVGHMNMGAGRIVYQELTRITKEIQDGDFFKNEAMLEAIETARRMVLHYIVLDYYQMVEYTATIHIYMAFLKWLREMV